MKVKDNEAMNIILIDTTIPSGGTTGTLTVVVHKGIELLQNADVTIAIRDVNTGVFDNGDTFAYLVTDENGMCDINVTRFESNNIDITAVVRLDNETARNDLSMTFNGAGIEMAEGTSVTSAVLNNNASANGVNVNRVNFLLKYNNTPVEGAYVIIKTESTSSEAKLSTSAIDKTDDNGYVIVTLTNTVAETVKVTVFIPEYDATYSEVVTFI